MVTAGTGHSEPTGCLPSGVVLQVSEPVRERQEAAFRNAHNLRVDIGERVPIEVVLMGSAVTLAVEHDRVIRDAQQAGIAVLACANSLRSQNALGTDLGGVSIVPAGVGHLVRRQAEGWAYLRP